MQTVNNIWNRLSTIGVKDSRKSNGRKSIILANRFNISAFVIFIAVLILELSTFSDSTESRFHVTLRFSILSVLCIAHLVLNHLRFYIVSKTSLLLSMPFFLLIFPTILGHTHNEYFLWYHYAPIAFSIIPYLILDRKGDQKWIFAVVFFYFSISMTIDLGLKYFGSHPVDISPIIEENYFYYKFTVAMIFIFVNVSLYYSFLQQRSYSEKLEKSNEQLEIKSDLLLDKNAELTGLNATKDKLFRIIGHDLKHPIGTMIVFMDLIENHIDKLSKERLLEIVASLKSSSQQGFKLLEELLDWAKSQTGAIAFEPDVLNLKEVVEQNIEQQQQKANIKEITLENQVPKEAEVYADRNMLDTILRNLISNALKFTPKKGLVMINCCACDSQWKVTVTDSGIGIEEEMLDKIFRIENKTSTKGTENESGTGLGLVICKEFVQKHEGKIWAELNPKGGSILNFTMPCKAPQKKEIERVFV